MLFTGWEVRIVKNCDRGLENAARGRRQDRKFPPAPGTNQIAGFREFRPLTSQEKK